ncbi:MAG: 23S rRNA (adenine(2503)-C(2))-methyltransferase RlmN [Proteobacteria bacterium]|jgi:23S rRNA (adenine2503-C2)-methyltransferase|nr:23S rRNA (adenine(2503)-C(2))-methyltransferase RlmN [Pseudomonadota bacterium]
MSGDIAIVEDFHTVPRSPKLELKLNLIGQTRAELAISLVGVGIPERQIKMRTTQIWSWIYYRGLRSFDGMTNLSKSIRDTLSENFVLEVPELVTKQISSDGTRKYLVRITGGHEVEIVYIPEKDRGTLCISSQVGCTLSCSFCHTGTQKLVRNLTSGEIIGQVMLAKDDLNEWPKNETDSQNSQRLLSNIVLMGMGEPLYNFESVRDAMKIAMDPEGISLSRRRITLSTSGVVPMIARTAEEIGCLLAVSFHGTTDEIRGKLVPINKKWNISELIGALKAYPRLSNSERITFEYVMLRGVNDSDEDAHRLVKLIKGIPAKINLIPFNEWPNAPYKRSEPSRIKSFSEIVYKAGYASPIRKPRGEDIMAACGQLKSESKKERKSKSLIQEEIS